MKIILEYQYDARACSFHYNTWDGNYDHPLFSNGYIPIMIIPENIAASSEFRYLTTRIAERKCPVQHATKVVYDWVLKHM